MKKCLLLALGVSLGLPAIAMSQPSPLRARAALALSLANAPVPPQAPPTVTRSGCDCNLGSACTCSAGTCDCARCQCDPPTCKAAKSGSFVSNGYRIEWWAERPAGVDCQWDETQKNWWRATWISRNPTSAPSSSSVSPSFWPSQQLVVPVTSFGAPLGSCEYSGGVRFAACSP